MRSFWRICGLTRAPGLPFLDATRRVQQLSPWELPEFAEENIIRRVDPDAAGVRVRGNEYRAYEKEQRALTREIADQTGQLMQRAPVEVNVVRNPLTDFDTIAVDEAGNWHAVQQ